MSSIILRDYQNELKQNVFGKWNQGVRNVLAVLPTGGGKSATTASIFKDMNTVSCLIAHRQELVAQLSEALASVGIVHRIIASKTTVQYCIQSHIAKFGRSFYHAQAPMGVIGVQTLLKRTDDLKQWCNSVKLWAIDEAHHVLQDNQWGKAADLFPNALGLGVTATPVRCDRKSLGREKSGLFDAMVEGPTMRQLIDWGYLSDYSYIAPPPSIIMDDSDISDSTGDYKPDAIRKRSHESKIVGDIVGSYMEFAAGKLGITFVIDIETANATAAAFRAAGIPAEALSGKTPDSVRGALMQKFRERKILQLINVDLFDEGLDVPGVEVVSMGRPTMSLGKYRQQAGRQSRPVYADGYDLSSIDGRLAAIAAGPKPKGMIIDHVNNVIKHRPPDANRIWSLNAEEKGKRSKDADDAIPITTCVKCFKPYENVTKKCPHCGHVVEPLARNGPEYVDGDLIELDEATLRQMRGEVSRIDGAAQIPYGASPVVEASIKKRWAERQEKQKELRDTIALWAGIGKDIHHRSDSEQYRRFYHIFGIDVLSAMTLGTNEANELKSKVQIDIQRQWS